MRALALLMLLAPAMAGAAQLPNELTKFSTDNCSGFPDGNWRECCVIHDVEYFIGGTDSDRSEADRALGDCVNGRTPILGWIMRAFVRFTGVRNPDSPFGWGYGWIHEREEFERTDEDRAWIERTMAELRANDYRTNEGPRAGRAREVFPTISGDYCVDEILRRLKKPLDRKTTFDRVIVSQGAGFVDYYTNLCRGRILARFVMDNVYACAEPRRVSRPTQFLRSLHVDDECAEWFEPMN
ncbi:MAG TPA: hypothetical protein VM598_09120 [Bdellovibrionota bacterium]|nr:hypothetical protein [Bdellovibrionota bacterium]